MRRFLSSILLTCLVIILIGCGAGGRPVGTAGKTIKTIKTVPTVVASVSPAMLNGLDAKAALVLANRWKTEAPKVVSSVNTREVGFEFTNGEKVAIPLPLDEMMVAVAPYINYTHPCEVHYMSGCQGELVGIPVKVIAKTSEGVVVLDETLETMSNGFFELWLPRDQDYNLFIEAEGLSSEGSISTYPNSNTCVTTIKLG